MGKKIGIKDIAQQLNVSKASVSVVLNGKARQYGISDSLENKILKFVKKIDYQPSRFAVGLRTGKSKTIGMLVEDISDPFFSAIARVVEKNAAANGYRVILGSTENDTDHTADLLQTFRNHQVDGYIIAPPPGMDQQIYQLQQDGYPVVLFDRSLPTVDCSRVLVDNFDGAHQAVSHLVDSGFRNIAMITLMSKQDQMVQRLAGYRSVLKENSLTENIRAISYDVDKVECIRLIKKFLMANKSTDAVFFATNYLALSGLEALIELDIRVPNDLGVIVFDDNTNFKLFNPSISAVAQPIAEIGEKATKMILDLLENNDGQTHQKLMLKTKLELRNSSANNRSDNTPLYL